MYVREDVNKVLKIACYIDNTIYLCTVLPIPMYWNASQSVLSLWLKSLLIEAFSF